MSDQGTVVASGNSPTEPVGSGSGGIWTPDCWHTSPDGLIAQARAQNEAGWSGSFAAAGRGSQPPQHTVEHF